MKKEIPLPYQFIDLRHREQHRSNTWGLIDPVTRQLLPDIFLTNQKITIKHRIPPLYESSRSIGAELPKILALIAQYIHIPLNSYYVRQVTGTFTGAGVINNAKVTASFTRHKLSPRFHLRREHFWANIYPGDKIKYNI